MKFFTSQALLSALVFGTHLVEASPLNVIPRLRHERELKQRKVKSTGAVVASSAVAAIPASSSVAAAVGNAKNGKTTSAAAAQATTTTTKLDANAVNCQITVPANPLTAAGLATPYLLQPPCSMAVGTQQAFAEAAVFDPATNTVSIYHPLVINAGTTAAAAPVLPVIPAGATVGLWFGFNGAVLKLVDANGKDTNNSPLLKAVTCINGLAGVQNDVFGQVSWCNAENFFAAANAGQLTIPPLGTDSNGAPCPTSRSFEITDACPSDNVPTQYLLLKNGATAQDTAANRAANPGATVINNASDEGLLANILDPLLGCTPFLGASLDNPGTMVPALALSELQASKLQTAPIGLVPLNDPDTLLTANGAVSTAKTNQYRAGVGQPIISAGNNSGALIPYCNSMLAVAPTFLANNQAKFIGQTSPAACVGNNLFTFLCERFIMSLTQLGCPAAVNPVACTLDGNGVAISCTVNLKATGATAVASSTVKSGKAAASVAASSAGAQSQAASVVASSVAVATSKAKGGAKASAGSAAVSSAAVQATVAPSVAASTQSPAATSAKAKGGKAGVAQATGGVSMMLGMG